MKKLLFWVLGIIVVLIVAALVGPSFVDWNKYKPEIAAKVKEATGRDLTIAGSIGLTVLPTPTLSVHDVSLANLPGAADPKMASLKSLDVRVALIPLLSGVINVESVALIDPVISLEVLKDGRRNWQLTPASAAGAPGAAPAPKPGAQSKPSASVQLQSVRIENGTVIYRDTRSGTTERIDKLNADISADTLAGPFSLQGNMVARSIPVSFDVSVGRIDTGKQIPLHVALGLKDAGAKSNFNGTLSSATAEGKVAGKLEIEGGDLGRLVQTLAAAGGSRSAAPTLPPPLAGSYALTAKLDGSAKQIALNDVNLALGDTTVTGAISVVPGTPLQFDVALQANQIDLDKWLKSVNNAPERGAKKQQAAPQKAESPGKAGAPATVPAAAFAVPANVRGTIDLAVGAAAYRNDVIHQIHLRAALDKGRVALKQASMLLPGGSDFEMSGTLSQANNAPVFDGNIEAVSDDLRSLLSWLGINTASVPPERLHKFTMTGKVKGTPAQVDLTGLDVRLDTTRVTGGVAIALRARPAFGIRFDADRLNVDAYLPSAAPKVQNGKTPSGVPAGGKPGPAGNAPAAAPGGLAFLNTFDANVEATVGALTMRNIEVQKAALNATLQNGVLTVRDASIGDLAGGTLKASGTVSGLGGKIAVDGAFDVATKDPVRLLRFAGIAPPDAASRLGNVELAGKAKGALESFAVDATLDAAGGRVGVKGTAGLSDKGPVYDLTVDARHANLTNFVRVFQPNYRPAAQNLGGFALTTSLRGNATDAEMPNLKATLGPVNMVGAIKVNFAGPRPSLGARIQTSEIIADLFLPPDSGAAKNPKDPPGKNGAGGGKADPPPTPEGDHWSREPFDTSMARLVDANVQLSAPAISYGKYRVEKPDLAFVLKDGVLDVSKLTGTMFSGAFDMKGQFAATDVPKLSGTVQISKADIRQALFQAGNINVASGKLDFNMDVAGAGQSPYALVSSLAGKGAANVADGVVRGFDLQAVSDQLKSMNSAIDFLKLFQVSMSGGQTKFSKLDGTFTIDKGIVRTDNVELLADAGKGTAAGTIDLPAWTINMKANFALTQHPNSPGFGMTVSGPLDSPERKFDTGRIEAYLVQRGVGGLLKKVLPQKESTTPSGQTAPATQEKPLDTLLKTILPGATQSQQPAPQQPAPQEQPVQPQPSQQPAKESPVKVLEKILKGK